MPRRRPEPRARRLAAASRRAVAALLAAAALVVRADAPRAEAPVPPRTASLYFFSPDWRPADLGPLAAAFEAALRDDDRPVSFQGFTRYEDFERQVAEKHPDFVLAPAWMEQSRLFASCPRLAVLARASRNGRGTYRKALMSRSDVDSVDDLAHGTIAATVHSTGDGSPSAVLAAFHLAPDQAKVVAVPKDVDALLALSFSQVDAALVTSAQYESLAARSPAEAEALRVLAFSPDVPMPPVFACDAADPAELDRVRDRLASLRGSPDGLRVLGLLGFDSFTRVPPTGPAPATAGSGAPRPPAASAAQSSPAASSTAAPAASAPAAGAPR